MTWAHLHRGVVKIRPPSWTEGGCSGLYVPTYRPPHGLEGGAVGWMGSVIGPPHGLKGGDVGFICPPWAEWCGEDGVERMQDSYTCIPTKIS